MYRKRNRVGEFLSRSPIVKWADALPSGARYWLLAAYYYPFSNRIERPVLGDALRQRLMEHLSEDVDRLKRHCGRGFEEWSLAQEKKRS